VAVAVLVQRGEDIPMQQGDPIDVTVQCAFAEMARRTVAIADAIAKMEQRQPA